MACGGITLLNLSPLASYDDEPAEGKISEDQLASAVGCDSNNNDLREHGVRQLRLTLWISLQEYNFKFKILSSLFDLCSENRELLYKPDKMSLFLIPTGQRSLRINAKI